MKSNRSLPVSLFAVILLAASAASSRATITTYALDIFPGAPVGDTMGSGSVTFDDTQVPVPASDWLVVHFGGGAHFDFTNVTGSGPHGDWLAAWFENSPSTGVGAIHVASTNGFDFETLYSYGAGSGLSPIAALDASLTYCAGQNELSWQRIANPSAPTSPPLPSVTPPLSAFPVPGPSFASQLPQFLQTQLSSFSAETQSYLATLGDQLQPLITPGLNSFLKENAIPAAHALETGANALDIVLAAHDYQHATDQVQYLGSLLGLSLPIMDQLKTFTDQQSLLLSTAGVVGDFAELGASPVAGLLGINSYIYGSLLAPQLEEFGKDPADPNFLTVVVPGTPFLKNLPTTGNVQLDAAMQRQMDSVTKAYLFLKAANESFDKYSGAIAAGDTQHAALQLEAMLSFLWQYNQAAQDAQSALSATQAILTSLGYSPWVYDPQQIRDLQAQILAQGLPQSLTDFYAQQGLSMGDIAILRQGLLDLNPDGVTGDFSTLNAGAADAFSLASTSVSDATATMPLLTLGLLGILVLGQYQRYRQVSFVRVGV